MPALPVGKLPPQLLQRLLNAHASVDPRVVVGPQVGEDAAVLDIGAYAGREAAHRALARL